jgi:hypothetical protein
MKQIRVLPEVWDDLDEAVTWYDQQGGKELGDKLEPIAALAGTHRLIYKQFSRVFAKPFPYAIYFRIKDDWVVVTLLWHTAKNPTDLKSTLTERDLGDQ